MRRSLREWLMHPWLTVRVQIALGAIFVAAAMPKIADPPAFAHMIYNYRILPGPAINLMALLMPWVEVLAGLALLLGLWRREAASWIGLMLLVFIAAIGYNLARGHAVDCGCFEVRSAGRSHAELLREMKWVLVRDVGLLVLVVQSLAASRRRARGHWVFREGELREVSAA